MVAGIAEASVGAALAGLGVAIVGAAASLIAVARTLGAAGVVWLNTVAVRAALGARGAAASKAYRHSLDGEILSYSRRARDDSLAQ